MTGRHYKTPHYHHIKLKELDSLKRMKWRYCDRLNEPKELENTKVIKLINDIKLQMEHLKVSEFEKFDRMFWRWGTAIVVLKNGFWFEGDI